MHCVNTIFESVRNRYNYKNRTYQNIINLNRGNDAGPVYTQTVEGVFAVDELIRTLLANHKKFITSGKANNSNIVIEPIRWETDLNFLIDEEGLFDAIDDLNSFSDYLRFNNFASTIVQSIKIDHQNNKEFLFGFEDIIKLFVDDGVSDR